MTGDDADRLIESQREYYDLRAPDYLITTRPDRPVLGLLPEGMEAELVEEFAPEGDVLELACGTGLFTKELARRAASVTAVDASPRMIERNRREVGDPRVSYVEADVFAWEPPRRFDAVFFAFWLSHVPPARFEEFWELVRSCLVPGGRVAFVDEDDRGSWNDERHTIGETPAARRTLADGRTFDIVKLFWKPDELEERLRSLGWEIGVRRVGETFLYGSGA